MKKLSYLFFILIIACNDDSIITQVPVQGIRYKLYQEIYRCGRDKRDTCVADFLLTDSLLTINWVSGGNYDLYYRYSISKAIDGNGDTVISCKYPQFSYTIYKTDGSLMGFQSDDTWCTIGVSSDEEVYFWAKPLSK